MKVVDLRQLQQAQVEAKSVNGISFANAEFLNKVHDCVIHHRDDRCEFFIDHESGEPLDENFLFFFFSEDVMIVGSHVEDSVPASGQKLQQTEYHVRMYINRKVPTFDNIEEIFSNPIAELSASHFDKWNAEESRPVRKIVEETEELKADLIRLSTAQGQEAQLYARHMLMELADVIWSTMGYARRILNRWNGSDNNDSKREFMMLIDKWIADDTHPNRTPCLLTELKVSQVNPDNRVRMVFPAGKASRIATEVDSFEELWKAEYYHSVAVFDFRSIPQFLVDNILDDMLAHFHYFFRDGILIVRYSPESFLDQQWIATVARWLIRVHHVESSSYEYTDPWGYVNYCDGSFRARRFSESDFDRQLKEANLDRSERWIADDDNLMECCSEDVHLMLDAALALWKEGSVSGVVIPWSLADSSLYESLDALDSYFEERPYDFNRKNHSYRVKDGDRLVYIHLVGAYHGGMPQTKMIVVL